MKIKYEFVNVRQTPLAENVLREAIRQLGMTQILNSKGPTFRKQGLDLKKTNQDDLLQSLLREQGMIRRPLIEKDGRFMVGFNEEKIISFITQ
jgi:arsenate reductase-like glutaredoxin family protein